MSGPVDRLEAGASVAKITSGAISERQALASIALSLKRIADALTGEGPSILTAPINSYGEGIGDAIQGQMIRGQCGVDQYGGR